MKPHTTYSSTGFTFTPPFFHLNITASQFPPRHPPEISFNSRSCNSRRPRRVLSRENCHVSTSYSSTCIQKTPADNGEYSRKTNSEHPAPRRRDVLVAPFLAIGASVLLSAAARADEDQKQSEITTPAAATAGAGMEIESLATEQQVEEVKEEVINSRIYDATVIGEPLALGKDKSKVWEKMMDARILYLGEAEQVPAPDDKELELEIVKNLRKRCAESERPISLALEAFPSNLQDQLNQYMDGKYDFQ